ncbi:cohesin complex subunit [Coemansia sp. IMI 203386]|nr:cohesin complex subunit [Coemansia sp. IMI 203386]
MATPTRRSARVSKAPDRLAPSTLSAPPTTPRKRAKNTPSAFATPLSARNKRQRTHTKAASRTRDTPEEEEEDDRSASDQEASASENDEDKTNADSDQDDDDDDEDEVSDFGEEISSKNTPRKQPAAAASAKQSKRKAISKKSKASLSSASANAAAVQPGQCALFNWVLDENLAIPQAAIDWLRTYRDPEESDRAVVELVNFFLKLTGCPGQIDSDDLYDVDKIPDKLARLQTTSIAALKRGTNSADAAISGVEVDGGDDLLMGKTKEQRRFRKNALQFVLALMIDGQHHLIFADVNDENGLSPFSEVVIWWLGQMSLSGYRPFRHVATLISLTMQSAMVTIRSRISVELQTTHRQLEAELSKRPASSRRNNQETAQAQRLRDRVATLAEQDEQAAAVFTALFTTIFTKRAIDIHSVIRAECLVPLATWCREYPAAYLQPTYLRYIGIGLHDKEPRVREACLAAALGPLLLGKQASMAPGSVGSGVSSAGGLGSTSGELVAEGFRPFIVRFLPRLVQMAAGDIDTKVQVGALKLIAQLARLNYLDPNAEIDGSGSSKKGSRFNRGSGDARNGRASSRRTSKRSTFSNPLSQQMLESSDSEDDQDSDDDNQAADDSAANGSTDDGSSVARESAFANIQPLYDDSADEGSESDPLPCPRHSTLRYLAPLVAHTHATVRAAAADLVSWWICEDWVSAAGSAAGLSSTPKEGSAEHSWLLYKSLSAFLYHLARMSRPSVDADNSAMETEDTDGRDIWIAEQAASCIEEMWNAPAVAIGLGTSGEEQQQQQAAALAGSTITGVSLTALDRSIEDAVYSGQGLILPRLAAAAQALWHKIPKLSDLEALASFLGWDHSAAQLDAQRSAFILVPSEESALVQAFAVWVIEHQKSIATKSKRVRNKKSKSDVDEEAQVLAKMWQSSFVPLLTRSIDSPDKLLPLVYLAADVMDLQQLFDSNSTGVLQEITKTVMLVLERYGGNVSLARLAAAFIERVDKSRILSASAMDQSLIDEDDVAADATVPGDLVCKAASTASALLSTAVASVPETTASSHSSAYSDVFACLVSLRAMIRSQDISAFLTGVSIQDCGSLDSAEEHADVADRPTEAAFDQLLLLLELAAKSSSVRTVPEKTAIAALDTAYYFVLWRALKLDKKLRASSATATETASSGEAPGLWRRVESSSRFLRVDRDRLLAICAELTDASPTRYRRLRELAFATLGRLLKLFTGPLTRSSPNAFGDAQLRIRDVRQSLVLARDVQSVRAQLASFFEHRLSEWAQLVSGLLRSTDLSIGSSEAALYAGAPSSWSIAYSRFCALAALWAQWIGDQTINADGLVTMARYTGMLGLETVEKRRLEQLASNDQETPAAASKSTTKRKIGFVALSAFDHIVQAAVDALKPMLVLQSTRETAMSVYLAAMRACYERYAAADSASGSLPVNSVNVGTLALFIGSALKTAFVGQPQVPATPGRGGRHAGDSGAVLLAPAVIGSAWTQCHERAISFGLSHIAPNLFSETGNALHMNLLDENGDLADEANGVGSEREPVSAEKWESLVEPWFAALSKTVSGIIRPRHAQVLNQYLEQCAKKLNIAATQDGTVADDSEYAIAAIGPYQRSLDKELAKLGAIQARMAETRAAAVAAGDESVLGSPVPRAQLGSMLLSSPPMSPTPVRHTGRLAVGSEDEAGGAMDVDE